MWLIVVIRCDVSHEDLIRIKKFNEYSFLWIENFEKKMWVKFSNERKHDQQKYWTHYTMCLALFVVDRAVD